jgi:hypothetical protein
MHIAGVYLKRQRLTLALILMFTFICVPRNFSRTFRRIVLADAGHEPFKKISTNDPQVTQNIPITVIVAAIENDNLTLLEQQSGLSLGDEQIVYIADNPNATYHVPVNKGNEAMVYLTFLIDRYDNLPDVMIFMHAGRTSWHNNVLLHWSSDMTLRRLRRSYIKSNGFTNLLCDRTYRCSHIYNATKSGFPASVLTRGRQLMYGENESDYTQFREIWDGIFPGRPIPATLGTVPGAQFSLTRETAQRVSLDELKRLRQWIIDVDLDAKAAGAVFERLWHMIFLGTSESVLCPVPHQCYCSLYGICLKPAKDTQSDAETMLDNTVEYGRLIQATFSQLRRIRELASRSISRGRDREIADLSQGEIGPGLRGLSEYITLLEKRCEELTDKLDEIMRKSFDNK